MKRRDGILTGILLAVSSVMVFFFLGFPALNQSTDQQPSPFSNLQNSETVNTIANDIDSCISNPTSDCDQEMMQIHDYCRQNNDQKLQFCSDSRVQMYLDNRRLTMPKVNTGT